MELNDVKISVCLKDMDPLDKILWKKLISSDYSDGSVNGMKDYLEKLTKITLVISKSVNKNLYRQVYTEIEISFDKCIKCSGKFYTRGGTICYKHLIDVLKTNDNIAFWSPDYFTREGYADFLCGCSEDLSCCFGIGGYRFQCEIHGDNDSRNRNIR